MNDISIILILVVLLINCNGREKVDFEYVFGFSDQIEIDIKRIAL